jgi:hypothetical protein
VFSLTRTEQKIYDTLSDGLAHKFEEIYACLPNGKSKPTTVNVHLTKMRKKLRPRGLDIVCVFITRQRQYRMIRPLYPSE